MQVPDWGKKEMVGSPEWDILLREYGPERFDDRSNKTLPQQRTLPPRSALNGTLTQLNDSWSPPDPGRQRLSSRRIH